MTDRQTGGISIAGILGVVFIVLKLTGVIAWSWWWVLAPFWIPFLVGLAIWIPLLIALYWQERR